MITFGFAEYQVRVTDYIDDQLCANNCSTSHTEIIAGTPFLQCGINQYYEANGLNGLKSIKVDCDADAHVDFSYPHQQYEVLWTDTLLKAVLNVIVLLWNNCRSIARAKLMKTIVLVWIFRFRDCFAASKPKRCQLESFHGVRELSSVCSCVVVIFKRFN